MAKRELEAQLAAALEDIDSGHPESPAALAPWLGLHERLDAPARLTPPTPGSAWGKQRMLAALAAPPTRTGGFRMILSLFSTLPKAAMLVLGGLVLTGSAVGATAAAGGPNIPVALLSAAGVLSDERSNAGIGNAPDAAETGKQNANERASQGRGNATATATGTALAGINNAPDAAQNGKDHANEHAFLGAGNASQGGPAGAGIENAPDAAQVGRDHANSNASAGAGNAAGRPTVTPIPTGTAVSGTANAPSAAQTGLENANERAGLGAANAEGRRP